MRLPLLTSLVVFLLGCAQGLPVLAGQAVPPRQDVNAPDLYIPLMAFVTYVLLIAYSMVRLTPLSLFLVSIMLLTSLA